MLKPLISILFLSFLLGGCAEMWPKSKEWRLEVLEENFLNFKNSQEDARARLARLENRVSDIEKTLLKIQQNATTPCFPEQNAGKPDENEIRVDKNGDKEVQEEIISPGSENKADKDNEQDLYKKALELIQQNKPEQARQLLFKLQNKFPGTKLMPNILYWIGETYYDQNQFARAILTFKQVVQKFPKHHKAAHALLKLAYAYDKLNDASNARFYLKILTQDYPESEAAKKAREKLKQLE